MTRLAILSKGFERVIQGTYTLLLMNQDLLIYQWLLELQFGLYSQLLEVYNYTVLYCIVLYCIVSYFILFYFTILSLVTENTSRTDITGQLNTLQYNTIQYNTIQYIKLRYSIEAPLSPFVAFNVSDESSAKVSICTV